MKWFRRIFYGLVGLFIVISAIGMIFRKKWSKDIDSIKIQEGAYQFEAKRDNTGVWVIKAVDENSLFFATGYVQGVDREFQTEALRLVALGRGTELMGSRGLPFARMMRLAGKVADFEWENRDPSRGLYKALESFAAGRNFFQKNAPVEAPIEYKFVGINRNTVESWTAADLLKVVRYHTWEFSFDYNEELKKIQMQELVGPELAEVLLVQEPSNERALYKQNFVRGVKNNFQNFGTSTMPEAFVKFLKEDARQASRNKASSVTYEKNGIWDESFGAGLPRGASNMWIVADPKNLPTPTLCNDTHLSYYWPSSLYPVRFEIPGKVKGVGYMLPGLPFLIIGAVDRVDEKGKSLDNFVWGITLASFANGQDLVRFENSNSALRKKTRDKFVIREPLSNDKKEIEIEEEWTEFGPRVDEIIPWISGAEKKNIALDWMGYRRTNTPLEFFYRRTLFGGTDVVKDLAQHWDYPSVNLGWMHRKEQNATEFGHAVTGTLFRSAQVDRKIMSSSEALKRNFSFASSRPYVSYIYNEQEPFILVTGNQKIYEETLSRELAFDWVDHTRAQRILDVLEPNASQVEQELYDSYMPSVADFVKRQRKKFNVDQLCGKAEDRNDCAERVAELDAWNGKGEEESSAATLASLWYMQSRWALLPETYTKDYSSKSERVKSVLKRWVNGTNVARIMRFMESNSQMRSRWENLTGRKWDEALLTSFQQALYLVGPASDYLKWGLVHRISWNHPIARMGGEVGKLLKESLLGPGPFVAGGFDSPGRSDLSWDPENPLLFPATHGSVMRMCRSFLSSHGGIDRGFRWTNITGPSGNPYSPWSKKFSEEYFLKNKLFRVNGF